MGGGGGWKVPNLLSSLSINALSEISERTQRVHCRCFTEMWETAVL